jgi:hypothetical protein
MNFVSWNLVIFLGFAITYMTIDMKKHFDTENTLVNGLYFTTTVHTTVGYGDITAKTPLAKMIVTAHMLCVWTLVAMTVQSTIHWDKLSL